MTLERFPKELKKFTLVLTEGSRLASSVGVFIPSSPEIEGVRLELVSSLALGVP
jgi:hypothetical protein